jgi:hypothetical protein
MSTSRLARVFISRTTAGLAALAERVAEVLRRRGIEPIIQTGFYPSTHDVKGMLAEHWGLDWKVVPQVATIHHLPFIIHTLHGPLFKGRDEFLAEIRQPLAAEGPVVIKGKRPIHGMGGRRQDRAASNTTGSTPTTTALPRWFLSKFAHSVGVRRVPRNLAILSSPELRNSRKDLFWKRQVCEIPSIRRYSLAPLLVNDPEILR